MHFLIETLFFFCVNLENWHLFYWMRFRFNLLKSYNSRLNRVFSWILNPSKLDLFLPLTSLNNIATWVYDRWFLAQTAQRPLASVNMVWCTSAHWFRSHFILPDMTAAVFSVTHTSARSYFCQIQIILWLDLHLLPPITAEARVFNIYIV